MNQRTLPIRRAAEARAYRLFGSLAFLFSVTSTSPACKDGGSSADAMVDSDGGVGPGAPPWAGILDRLRAIDWSLGNQGVAGGIRDRTRICATLDPGANTAEINAAIASCPDDQVVLLSAGTYAISSGISFGGRSNVTLRGAGPEQTILRFDGSDPCGGLSADICVVGQQVIAQLGTTPDQVGQVHGWTAGYAQGATQIELDSTAGLSAGMTVVLDQLDDPSETGGVLVSHAAPFVIENISTGRVGRAQMQWVKIVAIDGNRLTISPGLYMPNWRASQAPQIWWAGTVSLDGIENLTLDHSASAAVDSGVAGVTFWNTSQCWLRNVKSLMPGRNHVWLVQDSRSEVRDSYFYGIASGGGSLSYGIDLYMGSDALIINNIFQHITAAILPGTTSGNIIAYNFTIDHPYGNPDWMQYGLNTHDIGNEMILFEGNQTNGLTMDLFHGAGEISTAFRNQLTGLDSNGQTSNTIPVQVWGYNRFVNLVGNVLGTPSYHTVYEDSSRGGTGDPWHSIYLLGYTASGEGNSPCCAYDPLVHDTLLRWGNYDAATGTSRFVPSEIPTSSFAFVNGNAVPATQTLPASLFLPGRPSAWWGTPWGAPPWPAVGPDVTAGQDATGHAHKNPAQLCYENTPKDGGGILIFDATVCYVGSP